MSLEASALDLRYTFRTLRRDVGFSVFVILIVALIVIGPANLPEMAKSLGKALGEFRRVSTDVKRTIDMEAEQPDQAELRCRKIHQGRIGGRVD